MHDYILETHNLTKSFKGFIAVNSVDIKVRRGHIHALIGPNGAGKTTCFNLLTKFINPSNGNIIFNGSDITTDKPLEIARKGVIRSFQISAVFPELTVLDNVKIALQRVTGSTYKFWRNQSVLKYLNERVYELLEQVDLSDFANQLATNLPYGRKRALEIATTLAMEPSLMLLDEPTQGMGHEDVDRITQLIKSVSKGRTILMVEHNMKVISTIADYITVLAQGSVLTEGNYAHVSSDPAVLEAYMGTTEEIQEEVQA